ncbi:PREDICTED: rRNA-processing protein FCF1 homolog isoform X2 [Priapulus caudatus]|uniref:rRNA-processing protein FCF1 homolog isoform X2 n=1 Tax=Priapulus caudatus TaxID=37621 RepID=A0ABM1E0A9_PRICU|nr:PREDICTED: rRNA-processing protein FCF1 homolog isoform X2 [Priapulus caudatus]
MDLSCSSELAMMTQSLHFVQLLSRIIRGTYKSRHEQVPHRITTKSAENGNSAYTRRKSSMTSFTDRWRRTSLTQLSTNNMGKPKKTKKFAAMKRMISLRDNRIKDKKDRLKKKRKTPKSDGSNFSIREVPQTSSAMFFQYNTQLGPPYRVLVDTNFINFSIKNKLDIWQSMMDCLYAKCIPYITDCVMAELEKLGPKYRVALRIAKDPRFERLPCMHKGSYADNCLVNRVTQVFYRAYARCFRRTQCIGACASSHLIFMTPENSTLKLN